MLRILFGFLFFSIAAYAAETNAPTKDADLEKEAPNILYVVPWSETPTQKVKDPKLVLHNMLGDLYEPQLPSDE